MHVEEYLAYKKMPVSKFAKLCNAGVRTAYDWYHGNCIPTPSHMRAIGVVTEGLVTLVDIKCFIENKARELLTVEAASQLLRVQKPCVLKYIREGKIEATKINRKWYITPVAIKAYKEDKYNPEKRLVNGKSIWNIAEGRISPLHASKLLKVNLRTVYQMIKIGRIETTKINGFHVISADEIERIKNDVEELRPLF